NPCGDQLKPGTLSRAHIFGSGFLQFLNELRILHSPRTEQELLGFLLIPSPCSDVVRRTKTHFAFDTVLMDHRFAHLTFVYVVFEFAVRNVPDIHPNESTKAKPEKHKNDRDIPKH